MKRIVIVLVAVAAVAGMVASSAPASRSTEESAAESQPALADEGRLPDLDGAVGWLNSVPLNRKSLRGKVVLVDIWTYYLYQLPSAVALHEELGGKI